MIFLGDIRWGFLYSAPMIVLLVVAVRCWARDEKALSVMCALMGGVARPLLVRFVEPSINGCQEPMNLTIVNAVSMGLLQVLLVAYLGTEANWSNWKVDVGVGGLAGLSMAVARGIASQRTPLVTTVLLCAALALGGAVTFVSIRELKRRTLLLALTGAGLLAACVTFALSAIDCLRWS